MNISSSNSSGSKVPAWLCIFLWIALGMSMVSNEKLKNKKSWLIDELLSLSFPFFFIEI